MDNKLRKIINQEYYDTEDIDYILSLKPSSFKEILYGYNLDYYDEIYTILNIIYKTNKLTDEWLDIFTKMLIYYNSKYDFDETSSLLKLSTITLNKENTILTSYFLERKVSSNDIISLSKYIKKAKYLDKNHIINYITINYSDEDICFLLRYIKEDMALQIIDRLSLIKRTSTLFLLINKVDKKYRDSIINAIMASNDFNYIYALLIINYPCDKDKLKKKLLSLIKEEKYSPFSIKKVYEFLHNYYSVNLYDFLDSTYLIGYFISTMSYEERLEYLIYLLENKEKSINEVKLEIYRDLLKKKELDIKDIKIQEDIKFCDDAYKNYLDSMKIKLDIILNKKERILKK